MSATGAGARDFDLRRVDIPFGETFFHLGVHNLPPQVARNLMAALAVYTRWSEAGLLCDLLARLDAESSVLIVLNQPMWDQANVGAARHRVAFGI